MDKNHPFEDLLHQINDLLQIVADKADSPLKEPLPKDLESKLSKLERQVEDFRKLGNAYIAQLGVSEEDIQAYLAKVGQSTGKGGRKVFERSQKLRQEIEKKKAFLEKQQNQNEKVSAPPENVSISEQKNLGKKSPTARKSLFKRIGGNKNWRPL